MKLCFTLLFCCSTYLAIGQPNNDTVPARITAKQFSRGAHQSPGPKRFISLVSNSRQKIYEESALDNVYGFETVPMIEMNRFAGYAYFPEKELNEKKQEVKELQLRHDRQVRLKKTRDNFARAISTVMHMHR